MDFNDIKDFDNSPTLRALLVEYVLVNYEENAITDDHHLLMEYRLLKKANNLHLLFEVEMMNAYFKKMSTV